MWFGIWLILASDAVQQGGPAIQPFGASSTALSNRLLCDNRATQFRRTLVRSLRADRSKLCQRQVGQLSRITDAAHGQGNDLFSESCRHRLVCICQGKRGPGVLVCLNDRFGLMRRKSGLAENTPYWHWCLRLLFWTHGTNNRRISTFVTSNQTHPELFLELFAIQLPLTTLSATYGQNAEQ
jgi:hypothetical protein